MQEFSRRIRAVVVPIAVRILPHSVVERYRRRRALRQYLRALAYEIYDRQIRLEVDDLEGRIAARRDGFYDRLVKSVLERTELILQELDRRIEGVSTRHGNELRSLRDDIEALKSGLELLAIQHRDGETGTAVEPAIGSVER